MLPSTTRAPTMPPQKARLRCHAGWPSSKPAR